MSFIKEQFIKNVCRICKRTFCCSKCRTTHEKKAHGAVFDCDICVYGKTYPSQIKDSILDHFNETHWPLHCVHCKQNFVEMTDLKEHMECPEGSKRIHKLLISKTPSRPVFKDTKNVIHNLDLSMVKKLESATSTPIHNDNGQLQTLKCTITPVEGNVEKKLNSVNNEVLDNNKKEPKRRVTFGSTPDRIIDSSGSSMLKASLKKSLVPNELPFSPVLCLPPKEIINKCTTFMKDDLREIENKHNKTKILQSISFCENETLWESAVNLTIHCQTESKEIIVQEQNIIISSSSSSQNIAIGSNTIQNIANGSNTTDNIAIGSNITQNILVGSETTRNIAIGSTQTQNIVISSKTPIVSLTNNDIDEPSQNDNLIDCVDETSVLNSISMNSLNANRGLWSSVSHLFKNVVQGFSNVSSVSNVTRTTRIITKRHRSDTDIPSGYEKYKKIKLTDIKCRPTIRSSVSAYKPIIQKPKKYDKATQTNFGTVWSTNNSDN